MSCFVAFNYLIAIYYEGKFIKTKYINDIIY